MKHDTYDLLGRLSVAANLEEAEPHLVALSVHEFAPQSALAIVYREGRRPEIGFRWIPDAHLRKTFDTYYRQVGHLLDPFALRAQSEHGASAFRLAEIAPDRFETSDYFARYFQSTGMVDELGALRRLTPRSVVHFSIGRNAGFPRFTAREVRRFKQLHAAFMPKLAELMSAEQAGGDGPPRTPDLVEIFARLRTDDGQALSHREAQVAALITQGHSSRSIAFNLQISVHTVKVHRRNLYRKLTISSQNELFGLIIDVL